MLEYAHIHTRRFPHGRQKSALSTKSIFNYRRIDMQEEIICFCEQYQYPKEAIQTLVNVYDTIELTPSIKELFMEARQNYAQTPFIDYNRYLDCLKISCKKESVPWETASLLFHICLVPMLYQYYDACGLSHTLCHASLEDLKWKLLECRQVYGIWGSFVPDWFAGFFQLTRFTLGRLQFEQVPFPEDYASSGRKRPTGISHAINIHIPSSGPLRHEDCVDSYQRAADFFQHTKTAFFCNSWLLFPEHTLFLPEHSRILDFMKDFDIYYSYQDPAGSNLWRIFGQPDCSDIAGLPVRTSLQQAYKEWLLSGNTPGIGRGLFLY